MDASGFAFAACNCVQVQFLQVVACVSPWCFDACKYTAELNGCVVLFLHVSHRMVDVVLVRVSLRMHQVLHLQHVTVFK